SSLTRHAGSCIAVGAPRITPAGPRGCLASWGIALCGPVATAPGDVTFPVPCDTQTSREPTRSARQEGTRVNDTTSGADLAAKKLPELQAIAVERGIKGARRLRKSELIEAIRGGGTPPAAAAPAAAPAQDAPSAPAAQDDAASGGRSEQSRSRSRSRAGSAAASDEPAPDLGIELPDGRGDRSGR